MKLIMVEYLPLEPNPGHFSKGSTIPIGHRESSCEFAEKNSWFEFQKNHTMWSLLTFHIHWV